MPISKALILIFVVLGSKVPHSVPKHLIRIILVKYEKETRVLTALDHLIDSLVWVCLNCRWDSVFRVFAYLRELRLDGLRLDWRSFGV